VRAPCGGRLAGYPTCLAATVRLQAAGLLQAEAPPAEREGAPGDAFGRVYGKAAGRVRARLEAADPVLAGWVRCAAVAEYLLGAAACPTAPRVELHLRLRARLVTQTSGWRVAAGPALMARLACSAGVEHSVGGCRWGARLLCTNQCLSLARCLLVAVYH